MQLNYTFIDLFDVLGFVQGMLLGFILIFSFRRGVAFPLLGLFLIGYSADLITSVWENSGVVAQYPWLLFLPVKFNLLFMPALFLYFKSITGQFRRFDLVHLLPAFTEFIVFTVLFLFAVTEKLDWQTDNTDDYIQIIHIILSAIVIVSYSVAVILSVKKHRKKVNAHFSATEGKTMLWLEKIAWFVLFTVALILSSAVLPYSKLINDAFSIVNVIFIFWVALNGFKQLFIVVPDLEKEEDLPIEKDSLPDTPVEKKSENQAIFTELTNFIEKEKIYLQHDLNLANLSQATKIQSRHLSELINSESGQNFNQFINHYRVEAAKKMLKDPKFSHLNILGIGYEVGFNSKSSFNTTFKQFTGKTPSAFQKQ